MISSCQIDRKRTLIAGEKELVYRGNMIKRYGQWVVVEQKGRALWTTDGGRQTWEAMAEAWEAERDWKKGDQGVWTQESRGKAAREVGRMKEGSIRRYVICADVVSKKRLGFVLSMWASARGLEVLTSWSMKFWIWS